MDSREEREAQASRLVQMTGFAFEEAGYEEAGQALVSLARERWPDGPVCFALADAFDAGEGSMLDLALELWGTTGLFLEANGFIEEADLMADLLEQHVPYWMDLLLMRVHGTH